MAEPPGLPDRDADESESVPTNDNPWRVKATQNYKKDGDDEISFKKGSILLVTDQADDRFFGSPLKKKSTNGWFPCSSVKREKGSVRGKRGKKYGLVKASTMTRLKGKRALRGSKQFDEVDLSPASTLGSDVGGDSATQWDPDGPPPPVPAFTGYGTRRERAETLEACLATRTNESSLISRGIIKPTKTVPIFGVPLGQLMYISYTLYELPDFFVETSEFLMSNDHPKLEGMFRISGGAEEINAMKAAYDVGSSVDLSAKSPHSVSGLLKLFFRSLPQSLIPERQYDKFLQTTTIDDTEERFNANIECLMHTPPHCVLLLDRLIQLLCEVAQHAEINKMSPANLAIVFGPTLLRNDAKPESMMFDSSKQQAVVEFMIDNYQRMFETLDEKKKYRLSAEG